MDILRTSGRAILRFTSTDKKRLLAFISEEMASLEFLQSTRLSKQITVALTQRWECI